MLFTTAIRKICYSVWRPVVVAENVPPGEWAPVSPYMVSDTVEEGSGDASSKLWRGMGVIDHDGKILLEPLRYIQRRVNRDPTVASDITEEVQCASRGVIGAHEHYVRIDPSVTRADVEGALFAEKNAESTGWLFKHTRPGTHHTHQLTTQSALVVAFSDVLDSALNKRLQAGELNLRSTLSITRKYHEALCAFRDDCVVAAVAVAKSKHLGERHKDPHPEQSHVATEALAAITMVEADWTTRKNTDRQRISEAILRARAFFTAPAVETRAEQAARLKAEAESDSQ